MWLLAVASGFEIYLRAPPTGAPQVPGAALRTAVTFTGAAAPSATPGALRPRAGGGAWYILVCEN